jgi:hypothetical protein
VELRQKLFVEKSFTKQRTPGNVQRLERIQADVRSVNARLRAWQKQHPEWRPGGQLPSIHACVRSHRAGAVGCGTIKDPCMQSPPTEPVRWKVCEVPDCLKHARPPTLRCKAHGGGTRCIQPGCDRSAVDGYDRCRKDGGPRCQQEGCSTSARSGYDFCVRHRGGKRCGG